MSKLNTSDHLLCFPVHAVDLSLAHAPVKVRPSPHVHTARGWCVDEKVVNYYNRPFASLSAFSSFGISKEFFFSSHSPARYSTTAPYTAAD